MPSGTTRLAAVAARQYGLFTRAQAHRSGLTDPMLARRCGSGVYEAVTRHVFRVGGSERTWYQDLLAACFGGGPDCVASHRSAAVLHAFDGFRPGPLEVTVPRGRNYRVPGIVVHRSRDLHPADRCRVGPIPCTSPARTLLDLAGVVAPHRLEEALDGAERDGRVPRRLLARVLAERRGHGRAGSGPLAAALSRREAVGHTPRSVLERRMLRLLARHDLPLPVCQHRVLRPDGREAFLDFAYLEFLVGLEVDGHGSHATRRQRAADNVRASQLALLGWELHRFAFEQVMEEDAAVAHTVGMALERAGGGGFSGPG